MGCNASVATQPQPPYSSRQLNTITDKRSDRAQSHEIVQNFLVIWLDTKIDELDDAYMNSIKHRRQTVNIVETFHDIDECIDYISQLQDEKTFLIFSDSLCEKVIPRIHHINQLYSIFVFDQKESKYEEWAKDWFKLKGIFIDIRLICKSIRQLAQHCDENSVMISGVLSLNQIESSLMYSQLFKEILLEIDFD